MSRYTQNSGYGQAMLNMIASKVGMFGKILVVLNPSDTSDQNYQMIQELMKVDPEGNVRFFTTLLAAYTAAESNNNDVILINAHSNHYVSTMLTWAKNRIHVIGIGTFGATDMQPEIALDTASADAAATIKVTGFGNTFTNIYITNNGTHANSLAALIDAGENTVYTNCHFSKQSDLDQTTCANVIASGDTTTWRNCKFGVDWLTVSAARASMLIQATGSAKMKHNIFEDCYYIQATSSSSALHIWCAGTGHINFTNIWKNCIFATPIMASGSLLQQTVAVNFTGITNASILFVNPATNAASFATTAVQVTVVGMNSGDTATLTADVGVGVTPA